MGNTKVTLNIMMIGIDAIGADIMIFFLFDFMTKDNARNDVVNIDIEASRNNSVTKLVEGKIICDNTALNTLTIPNMRIFCLLNMSND